MHWKCCLQCWCESLLFTFPSKPMQIKRWKNCSFCFAFVAQEPLTVQTKKVARKSTRDSSSTLDFLEHQTMHRNIAQHQQKWNKQKARAIVGVFAFWGKTNPPDKPLNVPENFSVRIQFFNTTLAAPLKTSWFCSGIGSSLTILVLFSYMWHFCQSKRAVKGLRQGTPEISVDVVPLSRRSNWQEHARDTVLISAIQLPLRSFESVRN